MEETLHIAIENSLECLERSVRAEDKVDALEHRVHHLEADACEVRAMVDSLNCCNAERQGVWQGFWRTARTVFALISLAGAVLNLIRILLQ